MAADLATGPNDLFQLHVALRLFEGQANLVCHGRQQTDFGLRERDRSAPSQNQNTSRRLAIHHRQPDNRLRTQLPQLGINLGICTRLCRQYWRHRLPRGHHVSVLVIRHRLVNDVLGKPDCGQRRERPRPVRIQEHNDVGRKKFRERGQHAVEQNRQGSRLIQDGEQTGKTCDIKNGPLCGMKGCVADDAQAREIVYTCLQRITLFARVQVSA